MARRISGRLGVATALLGDLELGVHESVVSNSADSELALTDTLLLEYFVSASSTLSLSQSVARLGGTSTGGWSKYPGRMTTRWGLGLLNH